MSKNAKVWTALVTVYIIWGSTYLGIFYAGQTIPPLFAASTRFITSGTLMTLFVVLVRRSSLRVPRRELLSCLLIGILIAGQILMGAVIDRFGLFGVDQIAISPVRAAGIALLGIGAALSLVR